ncbi:MAG: hypothetical protein RL687_344 [Candidatus Parcubacteria bacterium]|jgi:hypothetical protein
MGKKKQKKPDFIPDSIVDDSGSHSDETLSRSTRFEKLSLYKNQETNGNILKKPTGKRPLDSL